MIAAIVLAAGRSSRFGANKLLQPLDGKAIVRHAVEAVLASKVEAVLVVTGNESELVKAALARLPVTFADNPDFSTGLSSSLICGVRCLPPSCKAALIALGDMPFVTPAAINRLVDSFAHGRAICVPVCAGRRGNPVLWGRRFFAEMLALGGDKGAKQLMALYSDLVYEVEVEDEAIHRDIDTPEDLSRHI
ncbi:MAG: nucleotidyltransferase family protein [Rhizomicrobium sp.]|nr:nucleotidyltransferase family protein [Rhizomicrobium sp.]